MSTKNVDVTVTVTEGTILLGRCLLEILMSRRSFRPPPNPFSYWWLSATVAVEVSDCRGALAGVARVGLKDVSHDDPLWVFFFPEVEDTMTHEEQLVSKLIEIG